MASSHARADERALQHVCGRESVFRSGDDADSDGVLCLREGAEAGKERPPFGRLVSLRDDPQPPRPGWGAAAGKTQNSVCTLQRMEPRAGGNNPAVQKGQRKRVAGFRDPGQRPDLLEYLQETELYQTYQWACAFVHGQDIRSKIHPFTFYDSTYHLLTVMMSYIFRAIRLYPVSEELEAEMQKLERDLAALWGTTSWDKNA